MTLLGATSLLATGVQQNSQIALAEGLDRNWRGAFDLLVTPAAAAPAVCGTANGQVRVAPNYGAAGGRDRISADQLDAVRGIHDVEVAAPIGLVGQFQGITQQLTLRIPYDGQTRAYDLLSSVHWDDGVIAREVMNGLVRAGVGTELGQVTGNTNFSSDESGTSIDVGAFPPTTQAIIAIDPVAERELLGEDGDFLAVLETLSQDEERAADQLPQRWRQLVENWSYVGLTDPSVDPHAPAPRVVPVIINEEPQFQLSGAVEARALDVQEVRGPLWEENEYEQWVASAALDTAVASLTAQGLVGDVTGDFAEEFLPFAVQATELHAAWLPANESPPPTSGNLLTVEYAVPGELAYQAVEVDEGCALTAYPVGAIGEASWPLGVPDGTQNLPVQHYRETIAMAPPDPAPAPVVVGRYSSATVDSGVDEVSYVPLGAYEVGSTWVLGEDPATPVDEARELRPSLDGLGLTVASPGGITDLQGGRDLVGLEPIDVIRVRVAGLTGYDEAGQEKVAHVASAIQDLGLHVNIVAGSSRELTLIEVPSYPFADGPGSLGWVAQEWSTLDAAGTVEGSLDRVGRLLLWLAVLTAGVASLAAAVFSGAHRRREFAVLRQLGWRRRDLARWMWSEHAVGAAALGAALVAAWWVGTRSAVGSVSTVAWVAALSGGVYLLGAALSWWLAAGAGGPGTRPDRSARQTGRVAVSLPAITRRLMGAAPVPSALTAVGVAAVGVGSGAAAVAVLTARRDAGRTRLAELMTDSLLPLHLGLVAVGLAGALLMLMVAGGTLSRARRAAAVALTAAGWAPSGIRRVWLAQVLVCAAVALLISVVVAAYLARGLGLPTEWSATSAVVGVLIAAACLVAAQWKVRTS